MAIPYDQFKTAAQQAYAALKPVFAAYDNFWQLGHSFDTIVEYFVTTDSSDAKVFAPIALNKYKTLQGDWYDDFGWWGISGLKASATTVFGGDDGFRTVALRCWAKMYENAPYGWARADQKKFKDYAPLIDNGVWNHVIDSGCNPADSTSLCGRQNTVTNGLYLVLAERLSLDEKVPHDPVYRLAANAEYKFLDDWFKRPEDEALLNDYAQGRAVVRERVSTFKGGAKDAGFREKLAWAGDQGLILGGLVDRMRFDKQGYQQLLATARKLMAGTKDYLVDRSTGILLSWTPDQAPGNDAGDYWTGPAVYMRYLLSAFQNADLKKDLMQPDYQKFVRTNAENVVLHPDRQQSGYPVVDLTNNLAILVAAVVMLKPAP
jgi:hypothetical protein